MIVMVGGTSMMKFKKGFSVVQLIVMLFILVVSIVVVFAISNNKIREMKKIAFESNVRMLIKGVEVTAMQNSKLTAKDLTSLGIISAGGRETEIGEFTIVSLWPTKVNVKGAKDGPFSGCNVSNATLQTINLVGDMGTDGVISGC